jgi:hypothetical protein
MAMRKIVIALAVAAVTVTAWPANAKTITRPGASYNGYANPGGCTIFEHPDRDPSSTVGCRQSDRAARIRYRFLRDLGGTFEPAAVSVRWARHAETCVKRDVRWMVPSPRTLRVIVPAGCYLHIVSVTWTQPIR